LRPTKVSEANLPVIEVRQRPKVGVLVENLTSNVVISACDVRGLLEYGHQIRVVDCTNKTPVDQGVVGSRSISQEGIPAGVGRHALELG